MIGGLISLCSKTYADSAHAYQTSVKSVGGALSKGLNLAFSLALA
jgi:hypothetical protein